MRLSLFIFAAFGCLSLACGLKCFIKDAQLEAGRSSDAKDCLAGKCYLMFGQYGNDFKSSQGCIAEANKELLCDPTDGKVNDFGEYSVMCSGAAESNTDGDAPALILDAWVGPLRCIQASGKVYKRIRGDLANQWKHGTGVPSPAEANLCVDTYNSDMNIYTQGYGLAVSDLDKELLCNDKDGDQITPSGQMSTLCCIPTAAETGICVPGVAASMALTCLYNGVEGGIAAQPGTNGAVGGTYAVSGQSTLAWCSITYGKKDKGTYIQGVIHAGTTTATGNFDDTTGVVNICKDTNCNTAHTSTHCWEQLTAFRNGVNSKTEQNAFVKVTDPDVKICVWLRDPTTKKFKQSDLPLAALHKGISAEGEYGCGGVFGRVLEKDGGYIYCCRGMMCNTIPPAFNTPRKCFETPTDIVSADFNQRTSMPCGSDVKMVACHIIQRADGTVLQGCGCPVSSEVDNSIKTGPVVYDDDKGGCCFEGDNCQPKPKKCYVQTKKAGFNSDTTSSCASDMCYWTYSVADGTYEQGCADKKKMIEICGGNAHKIHRTATTASWCCLLTGCNIPARPHVPALSCLYSAKPGTNPVSYPHMQICKQNENFCQWSFKDGIFTQGCAEKCTAEAGKAAHPGVNPPLRHSASKIGCCQTDNCNEVTPTKCLTQLGTATLTTIGKTSAACGALATHCILKKTIATGVIEQKCITKGEFLDASTCHGKANEIVIVPATQTPVTEFTCCSGDDCNDGVLIPAKPIPPPSGASNLVVGAVLLAVF